MHSFMALNKQYQNVTQKKKPTSENISKREKGAKCTMYNYMIAVILPQNSRFHKIYGTTM